MDQWEGGVIWCGDFNAHSTLWGQGNGGVIEEIMDDRELVCLNDGSGTWMNLAQGTESVLNRCKVSQCLAGKISWRVSRECSVGSDHFPIFIDVCLRRSQGREDVVLRWNIKRADWTKFGVLAERGLKEVNGDLQINKLTT